MLRHAALFLICAAGTAPALEIVETGRYALNRPASLDYDPTFCGLWIANEGPEIILVTLEGDELRRFGSDLTRIKAVTLEGDALLVADGYGAFQRITKNGDALAPPFKVPGGWADTEGITIDGDGRIISVEDDPERLSWLSTDGVTERVVDTTTMTPPIYEAQGIARDPRTGHLLIVDDWEGSNSLYEFDAAGTLLGTVPLTCNTASTPKASRSAPARARCSSPSTKAPRSCPSTTHRRSPKAPKRCRQARIACCFRPESA